MAKIYILDTSVIVHDAMSFKSFKENTVIIPITVLEELDKLKKLYDETGKNARTFIRTIDQIIADNKGDISKGIQIDNSITLKIESNIEEDKSLGSSLYGDNRILACALQIKQRNVKDRVTLVAKDIALRIRAKVLGINAEDYKKDRYEGSEIISNHKTIILSETDIDAYFKDNKFELSDREIEANGIVANDFVSLKNEDGEVIDTTRFHANSKMIKTVRKSKSVFGIMPKNVMQACALDLLLDDTVQLVMLSGGAGTGKTLLALAAGLHSVLEAKKYDKIIVMKSLVSVGKELGTLPGDKKDKLNPFLSSIYDNLSFLIKNTKTPGKNGKPTMDPYLSLVLENGTIEIEAISYLRGRSLPNALIIVDEMQNCSLHECRTILTRVGEGTKIVLTGDLCQIDNMSLTSDSNGFRHAIEKFRGYPISGSVILAQGERSPLATLAAKIL